MFDLKNAPIFLLFLTITSCSVPLDIELSMLSCDRVESAKNNDWSKVQIIDIQIENNKFFPPIIQLEKDKKYIFSILNKDDSQQRFTAINFFQNSIVNKIYIDQEMEKNICPSSIPIPPNKRSKIYLVPKVAGDYEFENTNVLTSSLSLIWGGPINLIFVNR